MVAAKLVFPSARFLFGACPLLREQSTYTNSVRSYGERDLELGCWIGNSRAKKGNENEDHFEVRLYKKRTASKEVVMAPRLWVRARICVGLRGRYVRMRRSGINIQTVHPYYVR